MANVKPDDVWLRLRFEPWRLPRDYPPGIDPMRLLARALKTIGRRYGWGNKEMFPAHVRPAPESTVGNPTDIESVQGGA